MDKRQTLVKEFVSYGLNEYSDEIRQILEIINSKGCRVSCHSVDQKSVCTWKFAGGPLLRISILKKTPTEIIWDLLHEFGHFLDGEPDGEEQKLDREIQAWSYASEELSKYPRLLLLKSNFESYKEKCLVSYSGYV
jgi:hypothetical protein